LFSYPEDRPTRAHQWAEQCRDKPTGCRRIFFRMAQEFVHGAGRKHAFRKRGRYRPQAHIDPCSCRWWPEALQGKYFFLQLAKDLLFVIGHVRESVCFKAKILNYLVTKGLKRQSFCPSPVMAEWGYTKKTNRVGEEDNKRIKVFVL
jgi:hypothetical protein